MSWNWTPDTLDALNRFLAERDLAHGTITTKRIGDGHSNLTFLLTAGDRRLVLRRPPPPPTPPGAHDMLREARLIHALRDSAVPVPTVLATAAEGEILDVPCYLMSFADGPVVTHLTPRAAGHAQDPGTGADRRSHGRHARRICTRSTGAAGRTGQRWAGPRASTPGTWPGIGSDWSPMTTATRPGTSRRSRTGWGPHTYRHESAATIVHNDYRIGNVVLAPGPPGRIVAVLDWELATARRPAARPWAISWRP